MQYSLGFPHVTIYSLRPGLCIIILPNTMPRRLRSKRMRKSMPAAQRSNNTGRGVYVRDAQNPGSLPFFSGDFTCP